MRMHLLVTDDLPEIPKDIDVLDDFGFVTINSDNEFITGTHLAIECNETQLRAWLQTVSGFWIGDGQPFEQRFHITHLTEEPCT